MGWLSKILGKKEVSVSLEDYSSLVVDFHSHLIPGIDDGVKTVEESVQVVESLIQLGFKKIITKIGRAHV